MKLLSHEALVADLVKQGFFQQVVVVVVPGLTIEHVLGITHTLLSCLERSAERSSVFKIFQTAVISYKQLLLMNDCIV